VFYALCINALLLFAILIVLITRGQLPAILPQALAQQAPIAGGGGVFMMPGQFSQNTWGIYLMDIDTQVLCAYQFYPGEKQLRFVASRNFTWDRRLRSFSTIPTPTEVRDLVESEQKSNRVIEQNTAPVDPEGKPNQ